MSLYYLQKILFDIGRHPESFTRFNAHFDDFARAYQLDDIETGALRDDVAEQARPADDSRARIERRDVQDAVLGGGVGDEHEPAGEFAHIGEEHSANLAGDLG